MSNLSIEISQSIAGLSTEEILREVVSRKQNALDNVRAEMTVVMAFEAEYQAGLSKSLAEVAEGIPQATKETHERSMQLYDFVIGGKRRAKEFEKTALLFDSIISCIEHLQGDAERLATIEDSDWRGEDQ